MKLNDVTTKIGSGATPRGGREVYVDDGVAFIRSQNVYDGRFSHEGLARITSDAADALRGVIVAEGDVLINITGESVTRTALVPRDALPARVSQHVAIVRPDPTRLDSRYLMSALLSPSIKAHLNAISSAGATRRALTRSHLAETKVALPELPEQRRIASVLGALDDLIETNQDQIARLVALARALAATAGSVIELAALARPVASRQVRPAGSVEHYSLPAFDDGATPERVEGSRIQSNKLPIDEPCVLVSRLNPRWERCWMAYPGPNAVASTEFVPLVGVAAAPEEVWAVTSAPGFWEQMRTHVTGTTGSHQRVDKQAVLTLDVSDVRNLPISSRRQVVDLVRAAHTLREEGADLTRARDELLPLLMSGKVRVADVGAA